MKGMVPTEILTHHHEDFFLDGPVTKRVAILNFDPATGELRPGVPFQRPANNDEPGGYKIADPNDLNSPDFKPIRPRAEQPAIGACQTWKHQERSRWQAKRTHGFAL